MTTKCQCGKQMSRFANVCRTCRTHTQSARFAVASAIVAGGKCPDCGQGLRRNSALTGWWQCTGYGAPGFRAASARECEFQIFTEH